MPADSMTVPVIRGAVVVQEGWREDPVIVAEGDVLGPELVEGSAVVEDTAFHDEGDVGAVVDVVERTFVEDVEVGQFADCDGTEVLIHAEEVGAVVGGHFECAHRTHRGGVHPQLPMRVDALLLAVSTEGAETTGVANVCDGLRDEREAIVGFRAHHAAASMRKDFAPGSPAQKFRVFVVVERLEEIFFVPDAGAADDCGRRVGEVSHAEKFCGVAVERRVAERMLGPGLAVHGHAEIVFEAAAFGGDVESIFARNFGDPLMLFAFWLEILLQRDDAVACEALDVFFGDFEAGEIVVARTVAGVEGIAGRKRARSDHKSGVHHFGRGKDVLRPRGGVERGGNAIGQVAGDFVIVGRSDAVVHAVVVSMHVDETRDDGFAFDVDDAINAGGGTIADTGDARAFNYDGAALNYFAMVEGQNSCVGEGEGAGWNFARHAEFYFSCVGLFGVEVVDEVSMGAAEFESLGVAKVRKVAAFFADLVERQDRTCFVNERRFAGGARGWESERVDVVAFLEGEGVQVWRDGHFVGEGKNHVNAAVGAVELDGNEIDRERAARLGVFVLGELGIVDAAVGAKRWRNDLIALEELGVAGRSNHQFCFTTGSWNGDEVVPGVCDPRLPTKKRAGAARNNDPRAIGTPRRMNVFARFGGELLRRAT